MLCDVTQKEQGEFVKRVHLKTIVNAAAAAACVLLLLISTAYADTDGTELQVEEPAQLEIQLGAEWSGIEFQLRTDAGIYPGVITVNEVGILSLEIGGSSKYILSCLASSAEGVDLDESQAPVTTNSDRTDPPNEDDADEGDERMEEMAESAEERETLVAGIPISHIAIFSIGIVVSVCVLVTLQFCNGYKGRMSLEEEDSESPD